MPETNIKSSIATVIDSNNKPMGHITHLSSSSKLKSRAYQNFLIYKQIKLKKTKKTQAVTIYKFLQTVK